MNHMDDPRGPWPSLGEAGDRRAGGARGVSVPPGESFPATFLRRLLWELKGFVPAEPLCSICPPAAEAGARPTASDDAAEPWTGLHAPNILQGATCCHDGL